MASTGPGSERLNAQLLVDSIPALIHTARPDGYLDYFNKPWLEYLGVTLDKVAGWNWTAYVHPEDVEGIVARWRACLASGEIFEYETRVRSANGEYRWMFHRKEPLRDANGNIVKWYGSSLDIDERKTAEEQRRRNAEELQRSEFYLAEGQRLAHMGSWAFDPDGFYYWSPELFRMHGLDPAGKPPSVQEYLDRVHPHDRESMADLIKGALAKASPFDATKRIVRPNGEVRYIRCVGAPVVENQILKKYVGSAIDVTEHELLTQELRRREAYLMEAQTLSHTGSFGCNLSTGEMFWSEETFRIYGYDRSTQPAMERVLERVYPEDRALVQEHVDLANREGKNCDVECRLLLPDDSMKHVRIVAHASKNELGNIEFIGALTDVTERKQAEALREGESRILEMIARDGALEQILEKLVRVVEAQFAGLLCSVLLLDEDGQHVRHGAAPSLPKPYTDAINGLRIGPRAGSCGTAMYRREPVVVSDILQDPLWEPYRYVAEPYGLRACWSTPIVAHSGKVLGSFAMYYREPRSPSPAETHALEVASHLAGIAIERKLAGDQLRRSEAYLAEAQRLSHTGSFGWKPDSGEIVWSDETYRIFEYNPTVKISIDYIAQRVHPEDRAEFQEVVDRASAGATHFEHAYRLLLPDGRVKHIHALAHALRDASGNREFVGAGIDVTSIKRAEGELRRSEMELRQIVDLAPQFVVVYGPRRDRLIYANRILLEYLGVTLEGLQQRFNRSAPTYSTEFVHPDDRERNDRDADRALSRGAAYESETRVRKSDGSYRWFLARYNPLRDEQGQITRWYVTATDIEDRKQAEDRLRSENVALREEIDKASMFEEIVGTSPALKTVLSRISKVAPSDSTVLITGETGTGKELVARAIHRRSARASRAFVSVNCAAIPRDLIASELFGHEKGAFTGATQQRLGRFELANGGTIFLDEVGELPAETQIALLRVLQEHEFERVGGTRRIRADVRVIAATNRDLQAAINAGFFRSDLFYRLNVFPIEIPSLRERREDIPLLVEYFIDRYARKAGKRIRRVNKKTLELLLSYPWPGNIRELQNVIERSIILCETEIFSIDENWLPQLPGLTPESKQQVELPRRLLVQEKDMIEAALKDTRGRVSGPTGAAVKLGIPRSTLESKIRSLHIDKNRYRS